MNKYFAYLKGTIISPQKTFREIIKDRESAQFVIVAAFVIFIVGLLNFVFVQEPPQQNHSRVVKEIVERMRFILLLSPLIWLFFTCLEHFSARLLSKTGKLSELLRVSAFIAVISSILSLLLNLLINQAPELGILSSVATIWGLYLLILSIRSVYKLSVVQSIVVLIIEGVLFAFIFMVVLAAVAFVMLRSR